MLTSSTRQHLNSLLAEYAHVTRRVEDEREALELAERHVNDVETAQKLVQEVAEFTQEQAHSQISSVVTRCLEAVFKEDAYQFKIQFARARGKTEARLYFMKDGNEIDPTEASGGGSIDVAALALRLALLKLSRPKQRELIISDEGFKFVNGEEYQCRVGGMLETLAAEMNVQLILVSDDDWLRIGKIIQL